MNWSWPKPGWSWIQALKLCFVPVLATVAVDEELGYILVDLGREAGPRGEEISAACPGVDAQDLATILDPFRAIFLNLGPDCLSEI